MVTTIQVHERTLHLLKKIRDETLSQSYDEAINRLVIERTKQKSMAGNLGYKPIKNLLKDLREKNDRY